MSQIEYTALVMAANRPGIVNPIAEKAGVSHKCLAPANGIPMLQRVVDCLRQAEAVGRIVISVEDPAVIDKVPALAALRASGEIETVASGANLFESVVMASDYAGPEGHPIIFTTADNALHTPELIDYFAEEVAASGVDVAVAMTPREAVAEAYPEEATSASYHKLRDGDFSNCNLYAITRPEAVNVAKVMKTGGQFRIKPFRVLKAFGLWALIAYKMGWVSLADIGSGVGKRFGIKIKVIPLPFADGPIDADNLKSYALVDSLLARREGRAA